MNQRLSKCVCYCVCGGFGGGVAEVVASSKVNAEILSHTHTHRPAISLSFRLKEVDVKTYRHSHTRAHTIGSKPSSVFEVKAIFSASLGRTFSFSQRRAACRHFKTFTLTDRMKRTFCHRCWTQLKETVWRWQRFHAEQRIACFSMSTSCFSIIISRS